MEHRCKNEGWETAGEFCWRIFIQAPSKGLPIKPLRDGKLTPFRNHLAPKLEGPGIYISLLNNAYMVTFLGFSFAFFWWGGFYACLCIFLLSFFWLNFRMEIFWSFNCCFCWVNTGGRCQEFHYSGILEPREKKNSYFPLYWLAKWDPYHGLL